MQIQAIEYRLQRERYESEMKVLRKEWRAEWLEWRAGKDAIKAEEKKKAEDRREKKAAAKLKRKDRKLPKHQAHIAKIKEKAKHREWINWQVHAMRMKYIE